MNKAFMRHLKAELILHKNSVMLMLGLYALIPLSYLISREFYFLDFEDFDTPKLSLVVYIVTLILAVLFSTSLFGECQREEKADVAFSLPISAKSRFLVKLTMAAGVMVIPYILGMLIILLTALIYSGIHGYTTDIIHGWAQFAAAGLAGVMFAVSFGFLCSVFTSSLAGARAAAFVGGIALTLLPILLYAVILSAAHIEIGRKMPLIAKAFGYGGVYALLDDINIGSLADCCLICALNMLMSVIFIIIARKVYCVRDRKSIFTFAPAKGSMLVFMLVCAFAAMSYMAGATGLLAALLAGYLAAALYLLILVKKGFGLRRSVQWTARLLAVSAVFAAVMLAAIKTEGFGVPRLRIDGSSFSVKVEDKTELEWGMYDLNAKKRFGKDEIEKVYEIFARYEESSGYEPDIGFYMNKGVSVHEKLNDELIRPYVSVEVTDNSDDLLCDFTDSYYVVKRSDLGRLEEELKAV